MRKYRQRAKQKIDQLKQALVNLTGKNQATEDLYRSRLSTRHVFIELQPDSLISGLVTGYFPEGYVSVMDEKGKVHRVHLDKLKEDKSVWYDQN